MFKNAFSFIESAIQWILCLLAVLSTMITFFPHVNDPLIVGRWVGAGILLCVNHDFLDPESVI